jgi:hypothetical protein
VKYALEIAACYEDEFVCFSADVKAKVNVGGAAVSRYIKIKSFCLQNDHDFPMQPKIVPMGYMQLKTKHKSHARSQSPPARAKQHQVSFVDDTYIRLNHAMTAEHTVICKGGFTKNFQGLGLCILFSCQTVSRRIVPSLIMGTCTLCCNH